MTASQIVKKLKSMGSERNRQGMARYGICVDQAFGISLVELRKLAKEIGKHQSLALELWQTGYHEARILAVLIADPQQMTETIMEQWALDFDSWDIVDVCCGHLFDKTALAWQKARQWPHRPEEFVRRAGFVLMCALAVHDKKAIDEHYTAFFPLIRHYAHDERNFVKKAVNWAVRQIGKRNLALNQAAIALAQEVEKQGTKPARWIARDALRELNDEKILNRLRKKVSPNPGKKNENKSVKTKVVRPAKKSR